MATQTFRVEGLSDLIEALQELPKATGKNVLKRFLTEVGQPIADDAQNNARRLTGALQRSFGVSQELSRRTKQQHRKESAVEVFAGPGALVQAITEEFGTSRQSPHPMLRPAWDVGKGRALEGMAQKLGDGIEKSRARLARKAARQIAKMK